MAKIDTINKEDAVDGQVLSAAEGEWVDLETAQQIAQKETPANAETPSQSESFLQLDSIIRRYMDDIDRAQKELKEQRTMYNDAFNNDGAYHEIDEKAKALNKQKKQVKDKITQTPAVQEVVAKMTAMKDELKSAQEMLSAYLERYVKQTGATTIEDNNGEVRQIVPTYKLVRKLEE